ncbi:MAG: transposase [Treponema sp.]|jgi:transposase-like protein|nr:transposase [Treponema sp.]
MGTKDKERRVYPKEFKAEAAALAEKHEKPVRRVAAGLGISENMPRRWIQQPREAGGPGLPPFPGHGRPRGGGLARLRKGVKALREADETLKKAAASPSPKGRRPPTMPWIIDRSMSMPITPTTFPLFFMGTIMLEGI